MSNPDMTILGEDLKAPEDTPSPDQDVSSYVSKLVGEGKAYATAEEAIEALGKKADHADNFIETLKSEKATVETELNTVVAQSKTIDDVLNSLQKPTQDPPEPVAPPVTPSVEPVDIGKTVNEILTAREQEQAKKATMEASWVALEKVYGDRGKAKLAIASYMGEDQGKQTIIEQLGTTDPEGLVNFITSVTKVEPVQFAEDNNQVSNTPTSSNLTWSYCTKVRKENPEMYRSPAFQKAMHEAQNKNSNFINT